MTLGDAIDQYIFYVESIRRRAASTVRNKRIYLNRLADSIGRDLDILELTNQMIDNYHADMQMSISARGGIMSVYTVNISIRSVKSLMNFCSNYLDLPIKCKTFLIQELREPEDHPSIIFFSDVQKVVANCNNWQDRLMIALAFESGLRIAELCAVRVEDFRNTTLDVIGKGQRHRITFLSDELKSEIDRFCRVKGIDHGYIFRPQMHGGDRYKDTDTVRRRIESEFKRTMSIKMHPHQLRHAFAINLLENGTNVRSIQKMLGHTKLETTMKYLGISNKYLKEDYVAHFGGTVLAQAT